MLEQSEMIFQVFRKKAMQAYIKYKAYYEKKPMPQNSDKQVTFTSYSRKQITKEAKFRSQIFGGLDLIKLNR